jgi:homopolymeric O-antigen transport system ATP-binding protein
MSSDQREPVVFDGVWKKFRRGERHDSLRDLIPAIAKRFVSRRPVTELEAREFWALQDVSFSVRRGEALGIIGPNGAGKSTALKLLTRILKPTRGMCRASGRVGALIEVAAGFHPDLTGRENIYLQGAIMGMTRNDIRRHLDAIIEFAGVSAFIDTPVKRYSSGMNARLGFSIAAHFEPDVLVIDEILSVGDMAFQRRCIERMAEFKSSGVAIVFVSHNLQAVANLCETTLFLQSSSRAYGPTADVLAEYIALSQRTTQTEDSTEFRILSAELTQQNGQSVETVVPGTRLRLRVIYEARTAIDDLTLGFVVHRTTDNLCVYHANVTTDELGVARFDAGQRLAVDYDFTVNLTRGQYHLECQVFHNPTHRYLTLLCPAGIVRVDEMLTRRGVCDLDLQWNVVQCLPDIDVPRVESATSV